MDIVRKVCLDCGALNEFDPALVGPEAGLVLVDERTDETMVVVSDDSHKDACIECGSENLELLS